MQRDSLLYALILILIVGLGLTAVQLASVSNRLVTLQKAVESADASAIDALEVAKQIRDNPPAESLPGSNARTLLVRQP